MAKPSKRSIDKKPKDAVKSFQKPSQTSFKPNRNSVVSTSTNSLPLQLEDDAPDFPRGGGSSLSRAELAEVRAEVDAGFEHEMRVPIKKRKEKVKNLSRSVDDDMGSLFGDGITGKLPRFANKITMKNISPGMKLWGVVAEVSEKDIEISLPGGLRGLVRSSEALDPSLHNEMKEDAEGDFLATIYHVGQLVSCMVLRVDDDRKEKRKHKIWLSLRLALLHKSFNLDAIQEGMVLSAYVKSIEDHGYILHFGIASFSGFMSSSLENESGSKDIKVNVGGLIQGVVKNIDRARKVVYLNPNPDEVSNCVTKDVKGISIDLLVPGMMVNARVRSTLENGIMVSFLTYFTGTVDIFHLENPFTTLNWKDEYFQNKKVNARILFIDPSSRAVGLTLNPYLVHNSAAPSLVKTGDIFDNSKVIRVDKGAGLLLEIPTSPVPTPAYVYVSDVSDKEIRGLERSFKEGSHVRVRVFGFRLMEGVAIGMLKTSAFDGSVFTHSDVKPGMVVKAKVVTVNSFGAIVQFSSGVKALCPLRHMSEFEIVKPRKKFQVGVELLFRVLGCKSKRITVTHKKTLVKSKLEILSSYADATEGLLTHGWIMKIENYGCFVRFYNGVHGFAPRSELNLDPGSDATSMYHVEQVVKCRVTSSVPASRRINLSFIVRPARVSENDMVKVGSLVSGVVEQVTAHAIRVHVSGKGRMKGTIAPEHLADNFGLAALMKSLLEPGFEFNKLLVLDIESCNLILSAKYSLVNNAEQMPQDINQVHPHSVVHGYICNIIDTGCFVRFIGRLTGFAPKNKATDERKTGLSEQFYVGQSVRSSILDVNSDTGRMTLSLKQSVCASTDASFIQEYFVLEEKIAKLQYPGPKGSELRWADDFCIGSIVSGIVHETKDSGVVISFEKYNDVLGFVTHFQLGGAAVEIGSTIQAMVLDIEKLDRLVDLSLKAELVDRSKEDNSATHNSKKKRKRLAQPDLQLHQNVNAVVEIVKENYLVLSLPENPGVFGYASLTDYNTQKSRPKHFVNGQCVIATIMALPNPSTAGRLLLLLKSISEGTETSSSKRAKRKSSYDVGSLVQAEITEMTPLELKLKFGSGFYGRIHITEVVDDYHLEEPFSKFKIGQTLRAKIVSKVTNSKANNKTFKWELSVKPSVLSGDIVMTQDFTYSIGQCVTGYVYKVDADWVWLTISRDVRAHLYILDSACEPSELQEIRKRYIIGKALSGYILIANKEKRMLRLLLHPIPGRVLGPEASVTDGPSSSGSEMTSHISEGDVVGGRISKILPGVGGLLVQIGPNLFGKVHYTELTDLWLPDPLSGFREGQFVKCKVLEVSRSVKGNAHIDLSLRSSLVVLSDQRSAEISSNGSSNERVDKIEDLRPDMVVQGYVKNVTPKGCFIMLSRKFDAKILLSNLSDGYVKNPEEEFPIGKPVIGKVVSLEPLSKRIEVTLRETSGAKSSKPDLSNLNGLRVGETISGMIRRIEPYGLLITVDKTNVVGLCHISELSEEHIDNIETVYRVGDRVKAKILKVDEDRHRISLGMKRSYISDDTDIQVSVNQGSNVVIDEEDFAPGSLMTMLPQSSEDEIQEMDVPCENGMHPVLAKLESRASILPLDVPLDETKNALMNDAVCQISEHIDNKSDINGKDSNRGKKKEKEEREREIRAAEERLLEKDVPRTVDDFEKLVRTSPNSSFIWIKYMAFMLSLADVEKARSVAERALRTINIREESEKLNIWGAYFNLENEYGNPPQEAVMKIFQRALQYSDTKKVHFSLLGMYERTEQYKLADELLEKMVKKFKHSCKVWLRHVQCTLKQNQDRVQSVVNRALICLPRHKHIKFITQTAISEFKVGVPDRGRSMFEGVLREYPKRTDLWSVYLDQEIRLGNVDLIRSLFERAICLKLPVKKMKFLFKKYLEFEKSVGDEERIGSVKAKALEYVENNLA